MSKAKDAPEVNLPTVTTEHLAENAAICMSVPLGDPLDSTSLRGVTPIYWGPPGIGKSSIIRAAARMALLHIEVLIPVHHNPDDFGGVGIPFLNDEGERDIKTFCNLSQVRKLIKKGEGILFIDEIGNAPPALQSAMLSLILERNVGDDVLPPRVRLLAAANPPDSAADGWDFEAPTANRFLHFSVPAPTPEMWLRWYMEENTPLASPSQSMWSTVTNNWSTAYPKAKSLIAGFIKAKGSENLYRIPSAEDPNRSRAWPSGRTWELAGRAMATIFALSKDKEKEEGDAFIARHLDAFVHGAVGVGPAREFAEWRLRAGMPDPEDMLKNGWTPDRRRTDIAVGALMGMTEYVIHSNNPKKWAEAAWNVISAYCTAGISDIAIAGAATLINAGLAEEEDQKIYAAAQPVIRRFAKSGLAKTL